MTREEAIEWLDGELDYYEACVRCHEEDGAGIKAYKMAIEALKQPERKNGKWIDATDTSGGGYYRCSECGTYIEKMYFANDYMVNFCPNCGARVERNEV